MILQNIWKMVQLCHSRISKTPSESLSRADVFICVIHENRQIINDVIRKNNTKIVYFRYFEKLRHKSILIWPYQHSTQWDKCFDVSHKEIGLKLRFVVIFFYSSEIGHIWHVHLIALFKYMQFDVSHIEIRPLVMEIWAFYYFGLRARVGL